MFERTSCEDLRLRRFEEGDEEKRSAFEQKESRDPRLSESPKDCV